MEKNITTSEEKKRETVLVLSSRYMGESNRELGDILMRSFAYTLAEQKSPIDTVLVYNEAAYLTCEGSEILDDLKKLQSTGTKILTCGTCLNFFDLTEKLVVGEVSNMYTIVEKMLAAGQLIKP